MSRGKPGSVPSRPPHRGGTRDTPRVTAMRITTCRKCGTPVAQWVNLGLTYRANPTALTTRTLAEAWLTGQATYRVRTLTTRQWAEWHPDSPANRRTLHQHLTTGQPLTDTILTAHTCPGDLTDRAAAFDTWQPDDRAYHQPPTRPAASEGIPF